MIKQKVLTQSLNERIAKALGLEKVTVSFDLMHELEAGLAPGERFVYAMALSHIIGTYEPEVGLPYYEDVFFVIHATPEEKAEAWLRAKNG